MPRIWRHHYLQTDAVTSSEWPGDWDRLVKRTKGDAAQKSLRDASNIWMDNVRYPSAPPSNDRSKGVWMFRIDLRFFGPVFSVLFSPVMPLLWNSTRMSDSTLTESLCYISTRFFWINQTALLQTFLKLALSFSCWWNWNETYMLFYKLHDGQTSKKMMDLHITK